MNESTPNNSLIAFLSNRSILLSDYSNNVLTMKCIGTILNLLNSLEAMQICYKTLGIVSKIITH